MFDICDARLVWIEARWPGLVQKGDGLAEPTEHKAEFQVELLDRDQLVNGLVDDEDGGEIASFRRIVRDWRGITNRGEPVPMTDENIKLLLNFPAFVNGFNLSYVAAWGGQAETREKNSDGSLADGPAGDRPAPKAKPTRTNSGNSLKRPESIPTGPAPVQP